MTPIPHLRGGSLPGTNDSSSEPLLVLGRTRFRGHVQAFGLLPDDRLRHVHVIGKTGVGKSTLLANLIIQDLKAGRGLALIDPHGDLVDVVLRHLPARRERDVFLVDPDGPLTINPFRFGAAPCRDAAALASSLVSTFQALWSDSWGPRLEHILRSAVLAVSAHPEASLTLLTRFLTDEELRQRVLARVDDPIVRQFWTVEFPGYGSRLQAEATAPVLNKLGAIVMHPTLRRLVAGVRSRLDLPSIIANQQILLARVPSSALGDDGSRLLGSLLTSSIQLAAWGRPGRSPYYLYVDEVQRFVTNTLGTVLSESRKFGLGLILAHQYLGQLGDTVRLAALGNVGSRIIFRVGAEDARALAPDLAPTFTSANLMDLGRSEAVMHLIARGAQLAPLAAETFALPKR